MFSRMIRVLPYDWEARVLPYDWEARVLPYNWEARVLPYDFRRDLIATFTICVGASLAVSFASHCNPDVRCYTSM